MANIPQNLWMLKFYEEELQFLTETDDLGDIPEAEASYFSAHGWLPGEFHWGKE